MATTHDSNSACCSIPAVQHEYTPQGTYKSLGGIERVYVTGEGNGKALLAVYDIFGGRGGTSNPLDRQQSEIILFHRFYPQTLQGADILSKTLGVQVVIPDFFAPYEPIKISEFPPQTEEQKIALGEFFGTAASPQRVLPLVHNVASALKDQGNKVGAYGYCWGGKITTLAGSTDDFIGVAALHPAMLSADDGNSLKVPIALFPSKDEPVEEYEKLLAIVNSKEFAPKNSYKLYNTMHHGWAAARGDLSDAENLTQYEDVYKRLAGFFSGLF
ncbi:alpha/beta-hydrolase [Auriculariales sp. MPI-PUGE-AT-0066]|nr:alpha/beta-hydrolase [Auriculariales sp. MPI-PUGE-AT-0066]